MQEGIGGKMIDKKDVIAFFDRCAPEWDAEMVKDDEIINEILDNAGVTEGKKVLDVACGTGVLFPYYMARGVESVVAIDISPKMAELAKEAAKKCGGRITVLCGDAETQQFEEKFDCIVVYNSFPHFSNPDGLIARMAQINSSGGRLTVAHGMSREAIDRCHRGPASAVSNGLPAADELQQKFAKFYSVDTVLSDDRMYQVVGTSRPTALGE